jgi:signal transduction histidine kinase
MSTRHEDGLRQAQARLLSWACLLVAIGALVAWYIDSHEGWVVPIERWGAALMGCLYMLSAVLMRLTPRHVIATASLTLTLTGVYFLGCLYQASALHNDVGLYVLASNAQFMPLLYVGAFVAMPRGAALLSWLHYAAIVALYLFLFGPTTSVPNNMTGHLWFTLLITHPCYIIALHYISVLKGRLRHTELEAHEGKARFLAMLSHEIRSPLQAMLGSIDLLAIKVHGPAEQRAVDRLRRAATQLDTHLRDVTTYTRLDDPSWRLHIDTVDISSLLQECCDALQDQAKAKGLSLQCQVDLTPVQDQWLGDATRLRQIIQNLLGNALKYTPQGQISVHAHIEAAQPDWIKLDVVDTGIGIPGEQLKRIFEPYVRLEDTRMAPQEGSGLGLAVVHKLVERLGGCIDVHSTPDQGSRFSIRLPRETRQ